MRCAASLKHTLDFKDSAIKKNTFESVLMRWMKLEPIIQSEVSQKEKPFFLYISKMEEKGNWCPKGLEIGP